MLGLPESPRARRRIAWTAAATALVLVGVAVALLIPSKGVQNGAPTGPRQPAQLAAVTPGKVSPTDRRAIDRLLDRFLPAAMEGKNADLAWRLAGPELRSGSTLSAWRNGTSPVPAFPLKGSRFHDWQTIDAGAGYVIFNLLLHPSPGSKAATSVFSGEVVKTHGHWLVNRLYTIAIMPRITKTTHEVGPADFAAGVGSGPGFTPPKPPGNHSLRILPILGVLSLILLIPIALGIVAFVRARRFKRALAERNRHSPPPLPVTRN